MARTLLIRGLLVGLVAGLVAFVVARLIGESSVAQAIALEGMHVHAHPAGEIEEPELVSRSVQSTFGLLTATTLYGVALGGFFALAFGFAQGRVLRLGARGLALTLAAGGFVVLYAVPFLKYSPNPPAVGNPDTIGRRTALYFTMIAISVLVAVLAAMLARRLQEALGGWNAALAGGVFFVVAVALAGAGLPAVQEVGSDFPATTLYQFRIGSFGIQLSLWATLGLLFGALTERAMRAGTPDPIPGRHGG